MNFRAKSKAQQWTLWLCAVLVGLAAYVVLSRILYGPMSWNIVLPRNQRIVLPILSLFWLFAWETRWDGVRREEKAKDEGQGQGNEVEKVGEGGQWRTSSSDAIGTIASTKESDRHSPPPPQDSNSSNPAADDDETGEELFEQARALRHQLIPDFDNDADYLDLLGMAAAKGHAPALAKLGEYAMRRCAWVEAYYWMSMAKRRGMGNSEAILRKIRKHWSQEGFPSQSSNVNPLFTEEAGRLGRALLRVDSGREAARAKEFLRANHPEFLAEGL